MLLKYKKTRNIGVKGRDRFQSLYMAGRWNYKKSDLGIKSGVEGEEQQA